MDSENMWSRRGRWTMWGNKCNINVLILLKKKKKKKKLIKLYVFTFQFERKIPVKFCQPMFIGGRVRGGGIYD